MEDFIDELDLVDQLLNNDLSNSKRKEILKQTIELFKKRKIEIDKRVAELEKIEKDLLQE
jgi:hypothetical protein